MLRMLAPACLALVLAWPPHSVAVAQGPERPRLAVIVVVDQMRADYLETFRGTWRGGFARLLAEGAFFANSEYPYLDTWTCPGHVTIGTGAFPRTHGIPLNGWYDRTRRASTTCTQDDEARHISYGRAAQSGNSGRLMKVPTFADELRTQRPGSRVVTMALKARSAIGLAGHGGTAVTWVDDGAAHFVTSRAYASRAVPAVANFLRRDPFTADARRTWDLRDPAGTYRYRDASIGARPQQLRDGLFPHRIGGLKGTDSPFFALWQASPFSDAYLERMAEALIDAYRLGQQDTTDFLGVSFSAVDLIGHSFGPESREIEDVLRRLDDALGRLFSALDARVGAGRWVLGLSADHGVAPIPVTAGGGRIVLEDIRDRIEETLIERYGPRTEKEGRYVASVTVSNIYLADGVWERVRTDAATYAAIEEAVLGVPGIERVLRSDRLSADSPDRWVRAAALSHVPGRSGEIIVIGREHWTFGTRSDGAATNHGTGHPYDRRVPLVLLGAGVRGGTYTEAASPADVAPTLAHLVGVKMPSADGRVLQEALK